MKPHIEQMLRAKFEADAEGYGFALNRQSNPSGEPWGDYLEPELGHRWAGYLACFDLIVRSTLELMLKALENGQQLEHLVDRKLQRQAIDTAQEILGLEDESSVSDWREQVKKSGIRPQDLIVETFPATVSGFVARNNPAVRILHVPSGLSVYEDSKRGQHANRDLAWKKLEVAVKSLCGCGAQPASACDERWGPQCDLGNNPAYVRVAPGNGVRL